MTTYQLTGIALPGASGTGVQAINDSDGVAGNAAIGSFPNTQNVGFVETGATTATPVYTTISVPGALITNVSAINNAGEIAGIYINPDGSGHVFYSTDPTSATPTLTTVDLSAYQGVPTTGLGINDSGTIAFDLFDVNGGSDSGPYTVDTTTGVVTSFNQGSSTDLAFVSINDSGEILGVNESVPFVIESGATITLLPPLSDFPGANAEFVRANGLGLSNTGEVVAVYDGYYDDVNNGNTLVDTHAYLIDTTGGTPVFQMITDPDLLALSVLDGINADGDLIGYDRSTGESFIATAACYAAGTRIAVPGGDIAIEALSIGDGVLTASGAVRPVRWIGRRSYDGRFVAGNRNVLPIVIRPGALADGVPRRALMVSPKHAMHLHGVLVPAELLVNGRSITQAESVTELTYLHVELDSHDVLLAEGAASESFVDCDSRTMFQNAATYHALYPDDDRPGWAFCAPRVEDGVLLADIRRQNAARAGLTTDHVRDAVVPGVLEGHIDALDHAAISGWAFDPAQPRTAVRLALWVNGAHTADIAANMFRDDLRCAGKGDGRCAFVWRFPDTLACDVPQSVELRRIPGGEILARTLAADPVDPGPLEGYVEVVGPHLVVGWAFDSAWPDTPVRLEVLDDDHVLGMAHADQYRPDLAAAGKGKGCCRFAFHLSAPIDAGRLRVRRAADRATLPMLSECVAAAA